jgi:hypothetical protein
VGVGGEPEGDAGGEENAARDFPPAVAHCGVMVQNGGGGVKEVGMRSALKHPAFCINGVICLGGALGLMCPSRFFMLRKYCVD